MQLTMTGQANAFSATQKMLIVLCMIVSACVVLLFGIWGIVGGPKPRSSRELVP